MKREKIVFIVKRKKSSEGLISFIFILKSEQNP